MSAHQKSSFLPYRSRLVAIPQRQRLNFADGRVCANTGTVLNFRDVYKEHSEDGKSGCAENMEDDDEEEELGKTCGERVFKCSHI